MVYELLTKKRHDHKIQCSHTELIRIYGPAYMWHGLLQVCGPLAGKQLASVHCILLIQQCQLHRLYHVSHGNYTLHFQKTKMRQLSQSFVTDKAL